MVISKRLKKRSTSLRTLLSSCAALFIFATSANGANITAFGDSITEGYGSSTGGYPAKLNSLLNDNGKPSVVANQGVGGENTYEGVSRFDEVLASFPAEIVLIMEGTNDVIIGIPVYTTQYNLQAMITATKGAGKTPVLATIAPSDRSDVADPIANLWNPMLRALANSNSIKLADVGATLSPVWGAASLDDDIHPNDYGYQIIANTMYSTIASMISSAGTVSSGGGGGSSSGGGGGGCFIATAAFGSPTEKHVGLLREFRDTCLLTNTLGRQFVDTYYRYSPPAADFISQHDNLKLIVRVLLYPLITVCYVLLKLSLPLQAALATMVVASCLALSAVVIRRRRNA
jgi:lysophospholipase L1-like esterase